MSTPIARLRAIHFSYSLGILGKPFQDRRGTLFGRNRDLIYLTERAELKGVTAVVGRAEMGKSWVLTEAARRLSEGSKQYLVGFSEASGPTDLFRQTVSDLYSRWLTNSTWPQQAQMIWRQQEENRIGKAGTIAGSIFSSLSKLSMQPTKDVDSLRSSIRGEKALAH